MTLSHYIHKTVQQFHQKHNHIKQHNVLIQEAFMHFGKKSIKDLVKIAESELSPVRHNPPVYVCRDYRESLLCCSLLLDDFPTSISFDTETTVMRKVNFGAPSVIQLASPKLCIIVQIYDILTRSNHSKICLEEFPPILEWILTTPYIIKYGCAATGDVQNLLKYYDISCASVLDTQFLSKGLLLPISLAGFAKKFSHTVYHEKETSKKKSWKAHKMRKWEGMIKKDDIDYASKDVFAMLSAMRSFIRNPHSDILSTTNIPKSTI